MGVIPHDVSIRYLVFSIKLSNDVISMPVDLQYAVRCNPNPINPMLP